jgi:hypothetical protein
MNGWLFRGMNGRREHESSFPDRYIVEFCTGLKDKGGIIDIYDGDIIKHGEREYVVKWNQLHCCFGKYKFNETTQVFVSELIGNAFPELGDVTLSDYEVIGNIHENNKD